MINRIDPTVNPEALLAVINTSFLTVVGQFGITKENAPNHPAFIKPDAFLAGLKDKYVEFYAYERDKTIIGTVAVTRNKEGRYWIERLAVLPEFRHARIGSVLMEYGFERIKLLGGTQCSIAIVEENTVLKDWYKKIGFVETEVKKYDHLPFLVCYMEKELPITSIQIKTSRLSLVPISFEYAHDIFQEFTDEITLYMVPKPAKDFIESLGFIHASMKNYKDGKEIVFAITKDKEFLGNAGIHHIDTRAPVLGIWVKKSAHGNGYGFEAIAGIVEWAKKNLKFDYLVYPVDKRNVASRRIPERLNGVVVKEVDGVNMKGFVLNILEYHIFPTYRKNDK